MDEVTGRSYNINLKLRLKRWAIVERQKCDKREWFLLQYEDEVILNRMASVCGADLVRVNSWSSYLIVMTKGTKNGDKNPELAN